ncbi:nitrogenase component 1 [Candidatus Methanomethylophilus sp. 1R26]|uniref:nitrogenase component 1 n=1 Tax=Candidatus Methanomethylophilus sp. 1R26 TaxID=1769296 RepID=UPI00373FCEB2
MCPGEERGEGHADRVRPEARLLPLPPLREGPAHGRGLPGRDRPAGQAPGGRFRRRGRGRDLHRGGRPGPGGSCAGKGIIMMFQALEMMGADRSGITIYDVLGDVVCGGFAVPMRRGRSDAVYIVTSGEAMSLYAANSILRGEKRFEEGGGKIAGLVLNRRGVPGEDALVDAFAEAVGVPVAVRIGRSQLFAEAERAGKTLCRMFPGSEEAAEFSALADDLTALSSGRRALSTPSPLTDAQLDRLLSEGRIEGRGEYVPAAAKAPASGIRMVPPRIGRGPMSAVLEAGMVSDIPAVVHGPRECWVSMMGEFRGRRLYGGPPASGGWNIISSSLSSAGLALGGADSLRATLDGLASEGYPAAIVLTTCQTQMSGDDVAAVASETERAHPGMHVIIADGGAAKTEGDAHMDVLRGLADLIDADVSPDMSLLAVMDDTFERLGRGDNLRFADRIIAGTGIRRTAGFLEDCSSYTIRNLKRAGIAVMGEDRTGCRELRGILSAKGIRFMDGALPSGFSETLRWLDSLERFSGHDTSVAASRAEKEYSGALESFGKGVSGRRVAVATGHRDEVSWIAEALSDAGATRSCTSQAREGRGTEGSQGARSRSGSRSRRMSRTSRSARSGRVPERGYAPWAFRRRSYRISPRQDSWNVPGTY